MATGFKNIHGNCPICKGEKDNCAMDAFGQVHCRSQYDAPPGFVLKGISGIGYGIYRSGDTQISGTLIEQMSQRNDAIANQQAMYISHKQGVVFKAAFEQLPLSETHIKALINRGITPAQIAASGLVSWDNRRLNNISRVVKSICTKSQKEVVVPGFTDNYTRLCSAPGLIIPMWDARGEIHGYQVRPDNQGKGKKYTMGGRTEARVGNKMVTLGMRNQINEPPTQIIKTELRDRIFLCEGTLKPLVASLRLGWTFLGAVGGAFTASPIQVIQFLRANRDAKVILAPDKGSGLNKQVLAEYDKLHQLLSKNKIDLEVIVWGQVNSKTEKDIDEVEPGFKHSIISYEAFKALIPKTEDDGELEVNTNGNYQSLSIWKKSLPKDSDRLSERAIGYSRRKPTISWRKGDPVLPGSRYLADKEDRLDFYRAAMEAGLNVLDSSPVGTGKTWFAGNKAMHLLTGNQKLFYLSKNSRNPSILELEELFVEFPVRNKGFKEDFSKRTPMGKPYRSHNNKAKADAGNCFQIDKFRLMRELGAETPICKMCPKFDRCREGQGDGYGYLNQVIEAQQEQLLRANLKSLSAEMTEKNILIVDEPSQSVDFTTEKSLRIEELFDTLQFAHYLVDCKTPTAIPFLSFLNDLISLWKDTTSWMTGLHHDRVVSPNGNVLHDSAELLELADMIDRMISTVASETSKKVELDADLATKVWVRDFIDLLLGHTQGYLRLDHNRLHMTFRDDRVLEVLQAADFVVYQDATLTLDQLALKTQTSVDTLTEFTVVDTSVDNLEIVQITGVEVGKNSKRDLKPLFDELRKEHNDLGVIGWKSRGATLKFFDDARGSNLFQDKQAILIEGVPFPNVGAVQAEYHTLKPECTFQEWYDGKVSDEITQALGRIRANARKGVKLIAYIVTNKNLEVLKQFKYSVRSASDVCRTVHKYGECNFKRFASKALELIRSGIDVTIQGLADTLDVKANTLYARLRRKGIKSKQWLRALRLLSFGGEGQNVLTVAKFINCLYNGKVNMVRLIKDSTPASIEEIALDLLGSSDSNIINSLV